jgi:hypothetical protein
VTGSGSACDPGYSKCVGAFWWTARIIGSDSGVPILIKVRAVVTVIRCVPCG